MKSTFLAFFMALACVGAEDRPPAKIIEEDFAAIEVALNLYKLNTGAIPTTAQGIKALVVKPTEDPVPDWWKQLLERVPLDPWGREYQYKTKERHFVIWSTGPNLEDDKDDISY